MVGGGIIGTCTALFLARVGASVTVVEKDLGFERSSTARSASAIRQQFNLGVNVAMSQFGYAFYTQLADYLPGAAEPHIDFVERGYLILATQDGRARLQAAYDRQVGNGAQVELLDRDELRRRFPWVKGDDLGGATFGTAGEGWFDPVRALAAVREGAITLGVSYVEAEVTQVHVDGGRVAGVGLGSGKTIRCSYVVDAAGPRAAAVARQVGVTIPIEARKRTAFLFRPEHGLDDMPNLVDPTVAGRGLYVRPYEDLYMAVTAPPPERDPDTDDLAPDLYLFEDIIRGALARRVEGFEEVELVRAWAGHYEMNTLDQNAIIGPLAEVEGFLFACGLSGHGVMHAPAIGRGIAELVSEGCYTTIDLSPFSFERIRRGETLDDIQPSEVRRTAAGI
ncbi:MAG: FAD-binding oxidoreductase [Actinomycetota bacterium]|nr:FAD-binding oxidoreductase [Actinomycetota bacterium]